ncbi:putative lipopolysaccharide heptosyltransferase I [Neisseria musculi]|uniref:Lipopolysaccharide heptosyltransferase I n=1 Tax=Neisseria musculi TaxID=1815583 RepID=A0A7H1M8D5_9NEIS|nr:putative lipopolysaccharide heptosyltransferase I [Neisseria musculi]
MKLPPPSAPSKSLRDTPRRQTGYPHYRLLPVQTEAGRFHCLLFYVSAADYLIIEPKIKRHLAVRKLAEFLKTATYPVYETVYGASL